MRVQKSFLSFFFSLFFVFESGVFAAGDLPETAEVDNALAQGYTAVQKEQDSEAIGHFNQAGNLAHQKGDWQGMIDAGYGLAALGKNESALPMFQDALLAAQNENSTPGLIASAYALASLPENLNALPAAEGALDQAMKTAEANQDANGAAQLAKAYQAIGKADKAARAQSMSVQLAQSTGEETRGVKTLPPPGWSPVGESIKGPKEVPVQVQQLNRASADRDIANKMEYIKQSRELEQREKERRTRLAESYLYYAGAGYYGYPRAWFGISDFGLFGFGRHQITIIERRRWATTQLSYFSPSGGFLIRTSRRR